MMPLFDPSHLRPVSSLSDISDIMRFAGECFHLQNGCSLHAGDVGHFLSSGLSGRDPSPYCYVYASGASIEALLLFSVIRSSSWELIIHPHHRDIAREAGLIAWAESHLRDLRVNHAGTHTWLTTEVLECDAQRKQFLAERGYMIDPESARAITMRSLQSEVLFPSLSEGYTMRSVMGEAEADALQSLHAAAFGRRWEPGEYLRVMQSPAYDAERELVVVAPDGQLAAFLVYWIDPVSSCGLFEPVGCHPAYRRRGLTKALLAEGLRRMANRGMQTAMVVHDSPHTNPASAALYRSVGFTTTYTNHEYRLPMDSLGSL